MPDRPANAAAPAAPAPTPPLPLVVLGGYLGAGKTTLINHLLRHAQGQRIAVLVNDFGQINIDADLIEGASAQVLALSGGCVCCSFGDDLLGCLQQIGQRQPRPDVVLLECSGVGLPKAVAQSASLSPSVRVQGVAVVFDAAQICTQAHDRYVGDTVRQQLQGADLLIANHADRCDSATRQALQPGPLALPILPPQVPLVWCEHGRIWPPVLLGLKGLQGLQASAAEHRPATGFMQPKAANRWQRMTPLAPAAELFCSETLELPGPTDPHQLAQSLLQRQPPLLRAKGVVCAPDGRLWRLHIMGQRLQLDPDPRPAHTLPALGQVLCISLRHAPDDGAEQGVQLPDSG